MQTQKSNKTVVKKTTTVLTSRTKLINFIAALGACDDGLELLRTIEGSPRKILRTHREAVTEYAVAHTARETARTAYMLTHPHGSSCDFYQSEEGIALGDRIEAAGKLAANFEWLQSVCCKASETGLNGDYAVLTAPVIANAKKVYALISNG